MKTIEFNNFSNSWGVAKLRENENGKRDILNKMKHYNINNSNLIQSSRTKK